MEARPKVIFLVAGLKVLLSQYRSLDALSGILLLSIYNAYISAIRE